MKFSEWLELLLLRTYGAEEFTCSSDLVHPLSALTLLLMRHVWALC